VDTSLIFVISTLSLSLVLFSIHRAVKSHTGKQEVSGTVEPRFLALSVTVRRLATFAFAGLSLVALNSTAAMAQSGDSVDSVTFKKDKVYAVRGDDQQQEITENLKFPLDVEITTNGTFTVGKGKERKFSEGQILLRDGWLITPGGSFQPVMDHVVMKEGRVLMVRDGQSEPLAQPLTFPNGAGVCPRFGRPSDLAIAERPFAMGELRAPVPGLDRVVWRRRTSASVARSKGRAPQTGSGARHTSKLRTLG